jgi:glycosyltransferase involved in cell wall biosynthesis
MRYSLGCNVEQTDKKQSLFSKNNGCGIFLIKLLFVTSYRPNPIDGASMSGRAFVKAIQRRGINCSVCTSDLAWPSGAVRPKCPENVKVYHAWFSMILEFSPAMYLYFIKEMGSFDIIHFRSVLTFSTVFGTFVARLLGKPYVISPIGDCIPQWKRRKTIPHGALKYLFYYVFLRQPLLRSRALICTSEIECHRLTETLGQTDLPYAVINEGIDTELYFEKVEYSIVRQSFGIPENKKIVLVLGRISKEKGLDFLLEVWESIFARGIRDYVLVIAGSEILSTGFTASIQDSISKLNVPESVIMVGTVSGVIKNALLQHSRCLVFPSYRESFGNVVLEALASGTPVIASTGTPWEILNSEKLGYWLPHDKDLWAQKIIDISKQPVSWKLNYWERSRRWVKEKYSWNIIVDQYIKIYDDILNDRLHFRKP